VTEIRLDAWTIAELADAIAERLASPPPPSAAAPYLLTARQVADRLGRSTDWVRDHRADLGVLPAEGERPRLLFDRERVDAFVHADAVLGARAPLAAPAPAHRRRTTPQAPLLPIRGRGGA